MEGRRVGNEEQRCDTRVSVRSKGVLAARGTDARSHRAHMAPRTSRASRSSSGTPPQSTRGQRDAPCRSACRAWLRVHRRPGRSPLPCTRWKACRRAASRRACSWVRGARCSRRAGAVAYTRITSCAHWLGCTRARANTKAQVQESPPREQVTRGAPFRASPPLHSPPSRLISMSLRGSRRAPRRRAPERALCRARSALRALQRGARPRPRLFTPGCPHKLQHEVGAWRAPRPSAACAGERGGRAHNLFAHTCRSRETCARGRGTGAHQTAPVCRPTRPQRLSPLSSDNFVSQAPKAAPPPLPPPPPPAPAPATTKPRSPFPLPFLTPPQP